MYVFKSTATKKSVNLLSIYRSLLKLHMNFFVLLYRNIFLRTKFLFFSSSVCIFLNES